MGEQVVKPIITKEQRKEYLYHLLNDIKALDKMVEEELFETGTQRIGAEQEICIVSKNFRPSSNSLKILEKLNDPNFTTEIGLFNLEMNMDPYKLKGDCFSKMEQLLHKNLVRANKVSNELDESNLVITGILPTLRKKDIAKKNMTPLKRYKILNDALQEIRGNEFRMLIWGVDELSIKSKTILFEACNTSFQVHLQVELNDIVDKYNWAQIIAGPVLSIMTNSPLIFGRELWSETRIAVFQQSIDTRNTSYHLREQKPRVSFGTGWVRNNITDLYKDDISRYTALITTDFEEDSMEELTKGRIPKLKALALHNGTLYKWNRLCYGITDGKPHFRIENRYIPSGPSVVDEIANAAFWVGLMNGMPEEYRELWKIIPFSDARGNFINAARTGINTYFNWFGEGISAKKLVKNILVPIAKNGLEKAGIAAADIQKYLDIIVGRVDNNVTGSKWIVRNYRTLKKDMSTDAANVTLTAGLFSRQLSGIPIHKWSSIKTEEGQGISKMYDTMRKVMTTEVFVAHRNDLLEVVKSIMTWKNIHHMPVVNKSNKMIGVITKKIIEQAELNNESGDLLIVNDVMGKVKVKVDPETTLDQAKKIMKENKVECIPIVENEELIGIFTKHDLENIVEKKKQND